MILDAQLMFTGGPGGIGTVPPGTTLRIADNVTATGATSNNIIDLAIGQTNLAGGLPLSTTSPSTQPFRDLGIGDDPAMKILVQAIGTSWAPGGATLAVALQGAPDSGTGTPGSFATWYTSPAVSGTTINSTTGGARLMDMDMPRPPSGQPIPRFLQLLYTVAGGPFTGTANFLLATLVLDRADHVYNATNNVVWGGYAPGITVAN
jgi:hypothetical protein